MKQKLPHRSLRSDRELAVTSELLKPSIEPKPRSDERVVLTLKINGIAETKRIDKDGNVIFVSEGKVEYLSTTDDFNSYITEMEKDDLIGTATDFLSKIYPRERVEKALGDLATAVWSPEEFRSLIMGQVSPEERQRQDEKYAEAKAKVEAGVKVFIAEVKKLYPSATIDSPLGESKNPSYTDSTMGETSAFADVARTLSDRQLQELVERGAVAAAELETRERTGGAAAETRPPASSENPLPSQGIAAAAGEIREHGTVEPRPASLAPSETHSKTLKMGAAASETTDRAIAALRLKWDTDREPDEDPAHFAARAYAAEMAAGTLHRGVIAQEDKPLAVKLASWLRSHPMPEDIDIPTLPEWNTRQIEAGKAKPTAASRPRTEGNRLYSALRRRRTPSGAGM